MTSLNCQLTQNSTQIDVSASFDVIPCRSAVVVLAANALIQIFECLLNTNRLDSVRIVKHCSYGRVSSVVDSPNSSMLFRDVVASRHFISRASLSIRQSISNVFGL